MADNKEWHRLGNLERSSMTQDQKKFYDEIVAHSTSKFKDSMVWRLDDGTMIGPFGIEVHLPSVGRNWLGMTQALAEVPGLPPVAREVAILVTGAHERSSYEFYAHSRASGLPEADIEQIRDVKCPEHIDEKCKIAFDVATDLARPGPLNDEIWQRAVSILGISGANALVHYVAFYKYVSTILNGFDAKLPSGEKGF